MAKGLDIEKAVRNHFERTKIHELPVLGYARQGGRTGVEVLARAFTMEGRHVYIGAKLAARSRGNNEMVLRIADMEEIPRGTAVTHPMGILALHEDLLWPIRVFRGMDRAEIVGRSTKGILMICTHKAPESIEVPLDFEGTVAILDADAIFNERIGREPAAIGITATGLFAAATDLIRPEVVKEAILRHERLSKRMRELNVECMIEAYEKTKILRDVKLKGKMTSEEFRARETRQPKNDWLTVEDVVAQTWRRKLPACDTKKCVCVECLAAYSCGTGALTWKDEQFCLDYDFCKGCGTCAEECPENAITMEPADKVLAGVH